MIGGVIINKHAHSRAGEAAARPPGSVGLACEQALAPLRGSMCVCVCVRVCGPPPTHPLCWCSSTASRHTNIRHCSHSAAAWCGCRSNTRKSSSRASPRQRTGVFNSRRARGLLLLLLRWRVWGVLGCWRSRNEQQQYRLRSTSKDSASVQKQPL